MNAAHALIAKGADSSLANSNGERSADVARRKGHTRL
jgi:hypothetical protein